MDVRELEDAVAALPVAPGDDPREVFRRGRRRRQRRRSVVASGSVAGVVVAVVVAAGMLGDDGGQLPEIADRPAEVADAVERAPLAGSVDAHWPIELTYLQDGRELRFRGSSWGDWAIDRRDGEVWRPVDQERPGGSVDPVDPDFVRTPGPHLNADWRGATGLGQRVVVDLDQIPGGPELVARAGLTADDVEAYVTPNAAGCGLPLDQCLEDGEKAARGIAHLPTGFPLFAEEAWHGGGVNTWIEAVSIRWGSSELAPAPLEEASDVLAPADRAEQAPSAGAVDDHWPIELTYVQHARERRFRGNSWSDWSIEVRTDDDTWWLSNREYPGKTFEPEGGGFLDDELVPDGPETTLIPGPHLAPNWRSLTGLDDRVVIDLDQIPGAVELVARAGLTADDVEAYATPNVAGCGLPLDQCVQEREGGARGIAHLPTGLPLFAEEGGRGGVNTYLEALSIRWADSNIVPYPVDQIPDLSGLEAARIDGQLDCQGDERFSSQGLPREGARGAPTAQEAVTAALDGYLEEGDELVATGPRTGSVVRDGREIVHTTADDDGDGWFATTVTGC